MNANGDLGRRLSDHYTSEAPHKAPDWVVESALETIDTTPQRRVLIRVPWRNPFMNNNAKMAVTAAVAVVVVVGAIALLRPGASSGPGGAPSAAPSAATAPSVAPSVAPSPSPVVPSPAPISTAGWTTFKSDRYGYTMSYPLTHTGLAGSTETAPTVVWQAQRDFVFETDRFEGSNLDVTPYDGIIVGPDGSQIALLGYAAKVPAGTSLADVINQGFADTGCSSEPVTIDGHQGRLDVCGDGISIAVAIVDDHAYVFSLGRGAEAKDLMMAYLSTMQLPTR